MDLKKYKFPKISEFNMALSILKTDKVLLEEAKKRGFYDAHTPYNQLFSQLFYRGGKIKFKEGLNEEFRINAWRYCRSFMSSFEPKHEDKEAICALLMSELLELNNTNE
jgi:hypothetical protein